MLLKVVKDMYNLPHMKEHSHLGAIRKLDMELQTKYAVGVVYFICEKDNTEVVKIGYTFNLRSRLEELQCAHYKELIVINYYYTQFPLKEEQRLHLLHKENRVRGEWFRME
jgi:hypothetical protein